jgi:hypothetical protein
VVAGTGRIADPFHPHRDTWYSAPMCQLNWWLPIYSIDPDNAMGFYPDYFNVPVKNNSEIGTARTVRPRRST